MFVNLNGQLRQLFSQIGKQLINNDASIYKQVLLRGYLLAV